MSAFIIRGIGFSATDVGTINKGPRVSLYDIRGTSGR